jgi:hypothetical protein
VLKVPIHLEFEILCDSFVGFLLETITMARRMEGPTGSQA